MGKGPGAREARGCCACFGIEQRFPIESPDLRAVQGSSCVLRRRTGTAVTAHWGEISYSSVYLTDIGHDTCDENVRDTVEL